MDAQELHVLAVDDSYVDRKVIERLLKISSCKVTLVDSGMRALQYLGLDGEKKSSFEFSDLKVNLILTDYSMPEMTGYELLKKIKGSSAFNQIPVVVMSSENIVTRIDGCLEEGAEEFLMKPVQLSDVKRITDFVLNGGEDGNITKETRKRKLCVCDDLSSQAHKLESPSSSLSTLIQDIDVAQETSTTLIRDIDVVQETSTTLIRDIDVVQETSTTLIRDIDVAQEISTTLMRDIDVAQETSTILIRDIHVAQETLS